MINNFFNSAAIIFLFLLVILTSIGCTQESKTDTKSRLKFMDDFAFILYPDGEEPKVETPYYLYDFLGKPIIVNFWSRTCGPCWKEIPELQKFYEENQNEVHLIGIEWTLTRQNVKPLLKSSGATYPVGYVEDTDIIKRYAITAIPTTFFLNERGQIIKRWTGILTETKIKNILER